MKESTVLEQICQMIGIERLAERGRETGANRYSKGLTVERLLLVLAAAQIRRAESLRDTAQLCSEDKALREVVGLDALGRSTLSDALVRFDAGLFENLFREAADKFAHRLRKERGKALRDILTLVDSTTIRLPSPPALLRSLLCIVYHSFARRQRPAGDAVVIKRDNGYDAGLDFGRMLPACAAGYSPAFGLRLNRDGIWGGTPQHKDRRRV